MDVVYELEYFPEFDKAIIDAGKSLDQILLVDVIRSHAEYGKKNKIHNCSMIKMQVQELNPRLGPSITQVPGYRSL